MTNLKALATAVALLSTFSAAQQPSHSKADQSHSTTSQRAQSMVDDHVRSLTQQLNLTADQQRKVRKILEAQREDTQKLMQDQSLSRDQRMEKSRSARDSAHKRIRDLLSSDQKKKLDAMEQQERERMRQGHGSMPANHP